MTRQHQIYVLKCIDINYYYHNLFLFVTNLVGHNFIHWLCSVIKLNGKFMGQIWFLKKHNFYYLLLVCWIFICYGKIVQRSKYISNKKLSGTELMKKERDNNIKDVNFDMNCHSLIATFNRDQIKNHYFPFNLYIV